MNNFYKGNVLLKVFFYPLKGTAGKSQGYEKLDEISFKIIQII